MKKILLPVLLLLFSLSLKAQFTNSVGARQAAMGNSGLVLTDIWSASHNQAGLAKLKGIAGGAYFANNFGMSELGMKAVALAAPISKYGNIGLNYQYFGYGLYNESKFGLSYAMQLGKRVSAGIQLDYFLVNQALEYGKKGAPVGEIGILTEPIDHLYIAAHIFNVSRASFADYQSEKIPSVLRIGMGYNFSKKVLFTIEAEKDLELPALFRSGIEYQLIKDLFLRVGVAKQNNLTTQYSFGAGYGYKGIVFDFAFTQHQMLGYTSQFGLSYTFIKKKTPVITAP